MSIFSKVKKARKAAEEHKKAAEQAAEAKPPPAPYKHVPTHAAHDALAVTPTTWSKEETRAKIAAARQRMSTRLASAPPSLHQASENSEHPLPSTRPMNRTQSDISIDSMIARSPVQNVGKVPLRTSRSPQPSQFQHQYSNNSMSRKDSGPPPVPAIPEQRPYCGHRIASNRSSMTRRKSPLSTVSMEPEPEVLSSSQESRASSASSQSSVLSSHQHSIGERDQSKLPNLLIPDYLDAKQVHAVEISLPYGSDEELDPQTHTLPAWRYEDYTAETEPPVLVEKLSRKNSLNSSLGQSDHGREPGSVTMY